MGYELYLLPLPEGADVEEAGEALLARMDAPRLRPTSPADVPGAEPLVALLSRLDPDLRPEPPAPEARGLRVVELRASTGVEFVLAARFARVLVPFAYTGKEAQELFRHVFELLAAVAGATGWVLYDPQEAERLEPTEGGCEAALEVFLTVMDQLRPSASARAARAVRGPGPGRRGGSP